MHKYPYLGVLMQAGKCKNEYHGGHREPSGRPQFGAVLWWDLLPDGVGWNFEVHTAIVVGFESCRQVEIGDLDLARATAGKVEECAAHDGIVYDVEAMA